MNKMQAAMRDRAAQNWKRDRLMRRVSSVFKGCNYCGEWEMRETKGGKPYKYWTITGDVYESYRVEQTKWTHWCYQCGAKDEMAWAPPEEKEPKLRERPVKLSNQATLSQIEEIEAEIAKLLLSLKK